MPRAPRPSGGVRVVIGYKKVCLHSPYLVRLAVAVSARAAPSCILNTAYQHDQHPSSHPAAVHDCLDIEMSQQKESM